MSVGEHLSADPACRRVLDQLVALVRVWTPTEGVVYVNRAWRDLTGTALEDNLGEGWLRAVHAEDRAAVLVAFGSMTGAGHADYRQARARAAPQNGAFRRVPIPAPHYHHVVVDVLCGCEDEILGHCDAGHRATARVDLDNRRRSLFGCVGQLG